MKKNPIETILGFGVLIFVGLFLFFATSRIDIKKVDGYQLTAQFMKVGGLEVGADVRISGIKVGSVLEVRLDPETYMADVVLGLIPSLRLPTDTEAAIADSGMMGGKYVQLLPGKSQSYLEPDTTLLKTRNYKSFEDNVSEFIFLSTK